MNQALRRASGGVLALLALGAALFLAAHHPLSAPLAVAAVVAFFLLEWRVRGGWLFVLPAALPALDFSPWSGWSVFDEFDLLALAMLAGGHARLARSAGADDLDTVPRLALVLAALFGLLSLLALARGVGAAGGWSFGWSQGYIDPGNSLRVAKSTFYVALAWTLLRRELRDDEDRTLTRFALGMLVGLGLASLAVISERATYPGLWNMTARYRTTGWFWEMRVGGGAIDAYLALAAPFGAWALWASRRPSRWLGAALLALAAAYACLTTFSRGLYLALALSLLLLGLTLLARRRDLDAASRWRRVWRLALVNALVAALLAVAFAERGYAGIVVVLAALAIWSTIALAARIRARGWRVAGAATLTAALMVEAVVVLGAGNFMLARMAASYDDYGNRLEHWAEGLAGLRGARDWLFGKGLGRIPALYAARGPQSEFSGAVRAEVGSDGEPLVRLSGPASSPRLSGLYGLTQRVRAQAHYRVRLEWRAPGSSDLLVQVCERHLLYDKRCQSRFLRLPASAAWQAVELPLHGPPLRRGEWPTLHSVVFDVSVLNPGASVELHRLGLSGVDGAELLANGDFARGLAHWLPAAQQYFVPWHIDNLYLELLIERGLPALLVSIALAALALRSGVVSAQAMAPFLAASLVGALTVGALSSVLDIPRVGFLLQLELAILLLLPAGRASIHGARP